MGGVALALSPYGALVAGLEDDPGGGVRVFVGARYRHLYFVPWPEDEQGAIDAWRSSYHGHCIVDERGAWLGPPHATLPGHEPGYHQRNALP